MTTDPSSSLLIAELRASLKAAILRSERGEARRLLSQLLALSPDDAAAKRNLDALLKKVRSDLDQVLAKAGNIRQRMLDGVPLSKVQAEFDEAMPSWRAFVDDFEALELVKHGLPAHEDPWVKKQLALIQTKVDRAEISEALELWDELGKPGAAASGMLTQTLSSLEELADRLEAGQWDKAKKCLKEVRDLYDQDEGHDLPQLLDRYLGRNESRIRWFTLLAEAERESEPDKNQRQRHLEALIKVRDEIQLATSWFKDDEVFESRLEKEITRLSGSSPPGGTEGSVATRAFVIVGLLIVVILFLAWFYHSRG